MFNVGVSAELDNTACPELQSQLAMHKAHLGSCLKRDFWLHVIHEGPSDMNLKHPRNPDVVGFRATLEKHGLGYWQNQCQESIDEPGRSCVLRRKWTRLGSCSVRGENSPGLERRIPQFFSSRSTGGQASEVHATAPSFLMTSLSIVPPAHILEVYPSEDSECCQC